MDERNEKIPVLDCVSWSLLKLLRDAEIELASGEALNGGVDLVRGLVKIYGEGRCSDDYLKIVFNDAFGNLYRRKRDPLAVAREMYDRLERPELAGGICRLLYEKAYKHFPVWGKRRFVWLNQPNQ